MEEVTTAQKVITDKSEKAKRIMAQASAKKEINHNINTGKPLTPIKSKGMDSKTVAPPKKEAKPQLAKKIDELIAKAGKWEDLVAEANKFCKDNGLKSVVTVGSFKTQLHWRRVVQKNPDYMIDRKFTDKGIEKVAKKK